MRKTDDDYGLGFQTSHPSLWHNIRKLRSSDDIIGMPRIFENQVAGSAEQCLLIWMAGAQEFKDADHSGVMVLCVFLFCSYFVLLLTLVYSGFSPLFFSLYKYAFWLPFFLLPVYFIFLYIGWRATPLCFHKAKEKVYAWGHGKVLSAEWKNIEACSKDPLRRNRILGSPFSAHYIAINFYDSEKCRRVEKLILCTRPMHAPAMDLHQWTVDEVWQYICQFMRGAAVPEPTSVLLADEQSISFFEKTINCFFNCPAKTIDTFVCNLIPPKKYPRAFMDVIEGNSKHD